MTPTTNRNTRVGTIAMVAVIGLMAVACNRNSAEPNAATPAAEPQTAVSTADQETPSGPFFLDLRTGETTPLATGLAGGYSYPSSPDGTRIAYGAAPNGGCVGTELVTVVNVDGTAPRSLESPEGRNICAARWSPDGTKLVYQERDGTTDSDVGNLFVQDLASGKTTQLTDLELSDAWWWFLSPSFSPDGRSVIFQLPRNSSETTRWDVWSVPVTGGAPTLVVRNAAFPRYLPDGKEIAFVPPATDDFSGDTIAIVSTDGQGRRRTLVEAHSSVWWPTMSPDGSRIAFHDGGFVYVADVTTGEVEEVAEGHIAEWLDDATLIVSPA